MRTSPYLYLALTGAGSLATAASSRDAAAILFPVPSVTATPDASPSCSTVNYTHLYDAVPEISPDSLFLSFDNFSAELMWNYTECTFPSGGEKPCPMPEAEAWCAFRQAEAENEEILGYFDEYVERASSWWAASSSEIVDTASACPSGWWKAVMRDHPFVYPFLNRTIGFASCGKRSGAAVTTQEYGGAGTGGKGPSATVGGSAGQAPTATPTGKSGAVASQLSVGLVAILVSMAVGLGAVDAIW